MTLEDKMESIEINKLPSGTIILTLPSLTKIFGFPHPEVSTEDLAKFYEIDPNRIPEDRPYAWYMFVTTADGKVSYSEKSYASGKEIAGKRLNEEGRIEMAGAVTDFRALQFGFANADAVLGGAGVLREGKGKEWQVQIPEFLKYRREVLKKQNLPMSVVISGSGNLDLTEPIFNSTNYQTVIFTSKLGEQNLREAATKLEPKYKPLERLKIYAVGMSEDGRLEGKDLQEMMKILRKELGIKLLDIQGGPDIGGQLLWEKFIDEYRLTTSPLIIGGVNSEGRERPTPFKLGKGLPLNVLNISTLEEGFGPYSFNPFTSTLLHELYVGVSANHVLKRWRKLNYRH